MQVFITGVAGFLGSHLADAFLALGHDVAGVDNLVGGYRSNVPAPVRFTKADCGNFLRMKELISGIDVVVHAACTAYEGFSVFSPHMVTRNTFQITAAVISASIASRVRRFIFCSSIARYGDLGDRPFTEGMECCPRDPYGIAKLAGEQLVRSLCEVHGIEYVIAVPHNIYGPRQKYDDPYRNVTAIMINRLLRGKQPIVYGSGTQLRCFSYIADVIECFVRLALAENVVGETVNIGPDEGAVTINDLAYLIGDVLDRKVSPIYVPDRPLEVKTATCSADKAKKLLGYCPTTPLSDGLKRQAEYIAQQGPKDFEYHLDIEIPNELCPRVWTDRLV